MPKSLLSIAASLAIAFLSACSQENAHDNGVDESQTASKRTEMLIYCGITMVKPIKEMATLLEPELGAKFTIIQGGSEDLYQSLKFARKGDLYLPGSASYREKHLAEGLLGEFVELGYNQAALFVQKNNPKEIVAQLDSLARKDLKVVIGDPGSGSIGRETRNLLDKHGLYEAVRKNIIFLATDSRNLNHALKEGTADVTLNWRATGFFEENRQKISVLDLDPDVAPPKKLLLNLLTFSAHPELAKGFMQFAVSDAGQAIMRRHGFLDGQLRSDHQE